MSRFLQRVRTIASAVVPLWLVASSASADIPPPDDQKRVSYSFTVNGSIPADRVVFAYPCGTSDGALRVVETGKAIAVGRRGGSCALYSIAKTAYDDFAKTYTPSGTGGTDPKLASFSGTALQCSGGPSPLFVVEKSDGRDAILEELDITLEATKCTVVSRGVPRSEGGGCSVGRRAGSASPWVVTLTLPLVVLGIRRRRRQAGRD